LNELQAFILGLIQGLTEFLPISSTGHVYLGRHIFGLDDAGLFLDTMLHIGTLIALVTVYKKELLSIVIRPFSRLSILLIVGTIPAVIAGILVDDWLEELSVTGKTIGWEFLVTGIFLWLAEGMKKGYKTLDSIRYSDALFIGCFQAAAILPALSRSGLTIASGLFRKLDRETAAYFSFLLSIPAILGGIIFQLKNVVSSSNEGISFMSMLIATLSSAIFGYIAVMWMLNFLKKRSLKIFAVYVWVLGVFIILMQFTGTF
jgi:undecaprenyl-diphosphatase